MFETYKKTKLCIYLTFLNETKTHLARVETLYADERGSSGSSVYSQYANSNRATEVNNNVEP